MTEMAYFIAGVLVAISVVVALIVIAIAIGSAKYTEAYNKEIAALEKMREDNQKLGWGVQDIETPIWSHNFKDGEPTN